MVFIERAKGKNRDIVVDGQQRIVTTSIFFIALRDVCYEFGDRKKAQEIENAYLKGKILPHMPEDYKIKVNKYDEKFYELLIDEVASSEKKMKKIKNFLNQKKGRLHQSWKNMKFVYFKFYESLSKELKDLEPEEFGEKINEITGNFDEVSTVLIRVSNEENAFLLFETLNSRGLELDQLDLIKNYLYSKISDEREIISYDRIWEDILSDLGPKKFLKHIIRYWIISKGNFIRENETFRRIRNIVKNNRDAKNLIMKFKEVHQMYNKIAHPSVGEWGKEKITFYLRYLNQIGVSQHIPIIYSLLRSFSCRSFRELLPYIRFIYSTLLFQLICKKSPSELEKKLADLSLSILKNDKNKFIEVCKMLSPSEKEVKSCLQEKLFKTSTDEKLAKIILRTVEDYLQDSPEYTSSLELTIEHIVPKSKIGEHGEVVYLLGNFTLLPENLNLRASTKDFHEKKKIYAGSKLKINEQLTEIDVFSPMEITIRTELLTDLFIKAIKKVRGGEL